MSIVLARAPFLLPALGIYLTPREYLVWLKSIIPTTSMQFTKNATIGGIVVLLILVSIQLFLAFDAHSHSASDTLRPFLIVTIPVWILGIFAIQKIARWNQA